MVILHFFAVFVIFFSQKGPHIIRSAKDRLANPNIKDIFLDS